MKKPAPEPRSYASSSPSMPAPRGEVSGTTSAILAFAACANAPALMQKFSSVQVRPESQYNAGISDSYSTPGGIKTAAVIGVPVADESCEKRMRVPPATATREISLTPLPLMRACVARELPCSFADERKPACGAMKAVVVSARRDNIADASRDDVRAVASKARRLLQGNQHPASTREPCLAAGATFWSSVTHLAEFTH
eukprot:4252497-Prymnesium_polylepis.2